MCVCLMNDHNREYHHEEIRIKKFEAKKCTAFDRTWKYQLMQTETFFSSGTPARATTLMLTQSNRQYYQFDRGFWTNTRVASIWNIFFCLNSHLIVIQKRKEWNQHTNSDADFIFFCSFCLHSCVVDIQQIGCDKSKKKKYSNESIDKKKYIGFWTEE